MRGGPRKRAHGKLEPRHWLLVPWGRRVSRAGSGGTAEPALGRKLARSGQTSQRRRRARRRGPIAASTMPPTDFRPAHRRTMAEAAPRPLCAVASTHPHCHRPAAGLPLTLPAACAHARALPPTQRQHARTGTAPPAAPVSSHARDSLPACFRLAPLARSGSMQLWVKAPARFGPPAARQRPRQKAIPRLSSADLRGALRCSAALLAAMAPPRPPPESFTASAAAGR